MKRKQETKIKPENILHNLIKKMNNFSLINEFKNKINNLPRKSSFWTPGNPASQSNNSIITSCASLSLISACARSNLYM